VFSKLEARGHAIHAGRRMDGVLLTLRKGAEQQAVRDALRPVYAPKLGYNLVDLGLVSGVVLNRDCRLEIRPALASQAGRSRVVFPRARQRVAALNACRKCAFAEPGARPGPRTS
jgi:hypothetical protein